MPLLYERQKPLIRRLAPVALLLAGWLSFGLTNPLKPEFSMARTGRAQGAVLARMFEGHTALPSVGVTTAGGYSFAYPGTVLDLKKLTGAKLGLPPVTAWQAERPLFFDRAVFLEGQPDLIIQNGKNALDRRMFKEMETDPKFLDRYTKGELWYNDEILSAYFSRRFLNGLAEGHYAFVEDLQYAMNRKKTPGLLETLWDELLGPELAAYDQTAPSMDALPFEPPPLWVPPPQL